MNKELEDAIREIKAWDDGGRATWSRDAKLAVAEVERLRSELTTLRASHAALMGAVRELTVAMMSHLTAIKPGTFSMADSLMVQRIVKFQQNLTAMSQAPAEDAPKLCVKGCGREPIGVGFFADICRPCVLAEAAKYETEDAPKPEDCEHCEGSGRSGVKAKAEPEAAPCAYCGPSWTGGAHLSPSCPHAPVPPIVEGEKPSDDRCRICRMERDDCGCPEEDEEKCWPTETL